MKFCMSGTNGHRWKGHPHPLPDVVVKELSHLLYLDEVGSHINEVWTCAQCKWIKVRDTYGCSYLRGRLHSDDEPPCDP